LEASATNSALLVPRDQDWAVHLSAAQALLIKAGTALKSRAVHGRKREEDGQPTTKESASTVVTVLEERTEEVGARRKREH